MMVVDSPVPGYGRPLPAAEAYCSSLQADSKARGLLELAAGPDMGTAWFTQTKVWKVSGGNDWLGVRGAYTEVRAV
jgi:hypothetical protein